MHGLKQRGWRITVALAALALVAAACGGGAETTTTAAAETTTTAGAPAESGVPFTAPLTDGGTFALNERVADKVRAGDAINYVFSFQSTGIPLFSDQYIVGYESTLNEASSIYPLNPTSIAPVDAINIQEQLTQIEALFNTDQIDCLAIQPPDSDAFTEITNRVIAAGIPVFTVGVTSNGNEFTNFTQIPILEGGQSAQIVLDWAEANDKDLKVFAMSGGDPSSFWAQGRMQGFQEAILAAIPDARFVTTYDNALQVGGGSYDPAITYDDYMALLAGNPDIDFIQNVDIGAEHANRAITDSGRDGEVFTIGWNVSYGQLDGIEAGIQVAALDQKWSEQAGFGALACAEFMRGTILPNTQELRPVTIDNVAEARAELDAILGG